MSCSHNHTHSLNLYGLICALHQEEVCIRKKSASGRSLHQEEVSPGQTGLRGSGTCEGLNISLLTKTTAIPFTVIENALD